MGRLADTAPSGPRILFIDLERISGSVEIDVWEPRDFKRINYVHPSRWKSKPRTICFAARWDGQRRGEFHAEWDSDDPHHLAHVSHALVSQATHIVTYYGKKADEPWLKQLWLAANLPSPRGYKHIDLWQVAGQFGLPSRSLAELCGFLGLPGKQGRYDPEEARACLSGDEKMRRRMRRYNLGDVGPETLGGVFERFRSYIPSLNLGAYYADAVEVQRCPGCGKAGTLKADGWVTADVQTYGGLRCTECGTPARNSHVKARTSVRGVR